ncbi:enoyl-CoA hydratase/isomerase family protein, partial [Rhodococcus sp. IEGM 69]|nr:enoyl-CoA hydratase/isomerase family protein [Rhodococcus sp. IEGM 69]
MSDLNSESEVIVETSGGVGRLVLNRPKAINALNHSMVRQIA